MKIFGFNPKQLLYDFIGVVMGAGAGIMLSDILELNFKIGMWVFIVSLLLSIVVWHAFIKKMQK